MFLFGTVIRVKYIHVSAPSFGQSKQQETICGRCTKVISLGKTSQDFSLTMYEVKELSMLHAVAIATREVPQP